MTSLITKLLLAAAVLNTTDIRLSKGQTIKVEVATSLEDLGRGLFGRKPLPPASGMIFVYPADVRTRYNLMGYQAPMDILYLDEQKTIINLIENAVPCRNVECGYDSIWTFRYALQVPAGTVKRLNIHGGDVVSFDLPSDKNKTASPRSEKAH